MGIGFLLSLAMGAGRKRIVRYSALGMGMGCGVAYDASN
jgi:hypothetical protein